jgi:peptidoglycan/LPS O-acetylase OafA/YrhL
MTMITAGYYLLANRPITLDQVASSLAFLPHNYDQFFGDQVIPQGWTLTYEFYFYCALAMTLAFGRYRWLAFGAWIFVFLVVLPIQSKVPLLDPGAPFASYAEHPYLRIATNPIIWEFVLGVLAGSLYRRPWWRLDGTLARVGAWSAIAFLLVWTAFCYNYINLELGIGYAAAIAVLGAATKSYRLPLPRIVVRIGDWSYSLYIEHFLLVSILVSVPREGPFGGAIALGLFVATPVLCVAIALFSGEFLERRLPTLLDRLLPTPSSRTAS